MWLRLIITVIDLWLAGQQRLAIHHAVMLFATHFEKVIAKQLRSQPETIVFHVSGRALFGAKVQAARIFLQREPISSDRVSGFAVAV